MPNAQNFFAQVGLCMNCKHFARRTFFWTIPSWRMYVCISKPHENIGIMYSIYIHQNSPAPTGPRSYWRRYWSFVYIFGFHYCTNKQNVQSKHKHLVHTTVTETTVGFRVSLNNVGPTTHWLIFTEILFDWPCVK